MFGVLCIYLLIGMLFSFAYALVGDAQSEPFFASGIDPDISDYLYFSFATMTTVGYGDLVPRQPTWGARWRSPRR